MIRLIKKPLNMKKIKENKAIIIKNTNINTKPIKKKTKN
jgi:hypothetical protein